MSWTYALDRPFDVAPDEVHLLVGGKAANLAVMLGPDLALPVPPAFAITTATCREVLSDGWPAGLDGELRDRMAELERAAGRRFGDPGDPLLVSVRSGAPVSMPGMMDTILNLGLTDATTAGLASVTGDARFAAACQERLVTAFRDVVGVDVVPDDPWAQLRLAIEAVFRSWNSDRAIAYRRREGIPDDLGTGVTIQAMVFGNRGADSGTGVAFTRNPATGEPVLYGDVLFDAQGEDVVAGTHHTDPISVLDARLPDAAASLRTAADRLEHHLRDLCDIEFTIEQGRLWLLQVRVGKRSPGAALRIAVDMAEHPAFPLTRREAVERVAALLADPPVVATGRGDVPPLVSGLGASPGLASGEVATSPEAAVAAAEAGRSVILVRAETSPDDVHGMSRSAGVLTAAGGLASHAAVVARGWGIPAVVGAAGIVVGAGSFSVAGRTFVDGDTITIDGASGAVYAGVVERQTEPVPEAAILLGWAHELGIEIGSLPAADDTPVTSSTAASNAGPVTLDACIRRLGTKGFATTASLADALLSSTEVVQPLLDALVDDGVADTVAGAYRLTDAGSERAEALAVADREAWGVGPANAALDAFLDLDQRMKQVVTDWQLKSGEGEPVVNDHADAAYDTAVLERLAALHADADAWLAPLEPASIRLPGYRERLSRAAERARAGDGKYVASPRVDSYHGIWFELHEDLIVLAGRTRADEVAAGRA